MDDANSRFIPKLLYHFKAEKWENPHSIGFTAVSHGCVDINRKTVNANIGITCIREDYYGKKFQLGTNVSEKGEKMFSSISVE